MLIFFGKFCALTKFVVPDRVLSTISFCCFMNKSLMEVYDRVMSSHFGDGGQYFCKDTMLR